MNCGRGGNPTPLTLQRVVKRVARINTTPPLKVGAKRFSLSAARMSGGDDARRVTYPGLAGRLLCRVLTRTNVCSRADEGSVSSSPKVMGR